MQKKQKQSKILVLGIGNILLRDEGIGIKVIEELKKLELPKNVELLDGATLGLSILNFLEKYDKVIVVDAVKGGNEPGTIYKFDLYEFIDDFNFPLTLSSMHDFDFIYAVKKIGREFYKLPEKIIVIGVEPENIDLGLELSEKIKKVIPKVVKAVVEELKN
ncbi:MAG: hydrogenase maturation protease [Archaeoglobaceae archaeon]|nr:hydrogenase maturation protease [Archaeoglobaceae archaeon]HDD36144.1 hydrogenase maturation protease [Archaeoglobus veneficus]